MGTAKKLGHVALVPGCGVGACKQTYFEIDPAELARLRPLFKKGQEYHQKLAKSSAIAAAKSLSQTPQKLQKRDQKPLVYSIHEQVRAEADAL